MGINVNRIIVSVGGIGFLPLAPGTWASMFACIVWYFISRLAGDHYSWQVILVIAALLIGIIASGKAVTDEDKDPSHIVIDELAGMWISIIVIPATIPNLIAGFILFRFFDITKPFGIKRMENYRSGWGIMLDDALAGIYSNILLRVILLYGVW